MTTTTNITKLHSRITELHEKGFMPWEQAVELALSEQGISLPLYVAINKLVCQIGYEGVIDSGHPLITEVMNALEGLDGGTNLAATITPKPSAAVPPGWKLVPIEATREMIEIGTDVKRTRLLKAIEATRAGKDYSKMTIEGAEAEYRAMVSAAPQPPAHSVEAQGAGLPTTGLQPECEFLRELIAEVHRDQLPTNRLQNIAARAELRLRKLP